MLIGIFIREETIQKLKNQNSTIKINNLIENGKDAQCTLYFFSMKDIDFSTLKIDGVYFNYAEKSWQQKTFPFPDVFYNRIAGGLEKEDHKQLKDKLEELKIIRINARDEFDKWEVYQILNPNQRLHPNLPFTIQYTNPKDLKKMFQKSSVLYLKGRNGRQGKEIMRIQKEGKNGFLCSYFSATPIAYHINSLPDLIGSISNFFNDKPFIIQKGIDILTYKNNPVDMRAEVQRNGKGNLKIVAIPVRIGVMGSPVTNSRTKSNIMPIKTFFKKRLNYSNDEYGILAKRIKSFLTEVYISIEAAYGPFGELGIDFALDNNNKLWLIEVNATSGKRALSKGYDSKTMKKALQNPLEYASYISAQKKAKA